MRKRASDTTADAAQSTGDNDRQFVTALHRGLEILRAFHPSDQAGLGNRELAERTGLPNSTVSRLTFTLLKLGYLVYDEGIGRYRMGVPVLSLGYACLGGMRVKETAQVYMQQLADRCGDGVLVALGGRDNMSMTYVATARSPGMISLQLNVGSRISITRSAMGRAYIAACDETEYGDIIERIHARYDPADVPGIVNEIENAKQQISDRGFYSNIGGWQEDVHAVAVPYRAPHGDNPLMVFNLGGPAYVLPKDRLENDLGPQLVELVNTVARAGF